MDRLQQGQGMVSGMLRLNLCLISVALLGFAALWVSGAARGQQRVDPVVARSATASVDTLDDVVVKNERERQRKAPIPRRVNNPDVITVTGGDVRARLRTRTPQREIRFRRYSITRQAADGLHPPMQLQRDRLVAGSRTRLIEDVTLTFTPGLDEADGLPVLIPFGPTTSLLNIDYLRVHDSLPPTVINLHNVIDPETRRCASSIALGDDGGDHPYRFVLLGRNLVDCNRVVKSREGDLLFGDGVPERLRRELIELYGPIYSRFAGQLGSEPGFVFVVWRPDSARSDFRFEFSLDRTRLLVFNGPSWQHGFTPQQRDALWEEFAREQIMRRIRGQGDVDAVTGSAVYYLLRLAQAEHKHATVSWLTAELPQWIGACARAMSVRARTTDSTLTVPSYDCGLVLQFVYDAVSRAQSRSGEDVRRIWRTLLTNSFRRGKSGVQSSAFIDSSADAHRIVQGLFDGSIDWIRFAADLAGFGVELQVAVDQLAPTVQVQSLTNFHD